jgi:hypothetical protein
MTSLRSLGISGTSRARCFMLCSGFAGASRMPCGLTNQLRSAWGLINTLIMKAYSPKTATIAHCD